MQTTTKPHSRQYIDLTVLPAQVSDRAAVTLLDAVRRTFEDPAIASEFRKWKNERGRKHDREFRS